MLAVPQIVKAEKIFKDKKDFLKEKELPYEIHLLNEMKFHSVFICPVTKEASTEDNPPMLLTCGHVISKNAINKMINSSTLRNRTQIKCPTCPNTQSEADCIELKIFS